MQALKLNPLSNLQGSRRFEYVLMVWAHQGIVHLIKRDSLVGVQANADYGDMGLPDGWIESVEVAE